jgi:t-SNARE complex subunit (syntaxin)
MHCILEGLVQYHFRELLKLTNSEANTDPSRIPAFHYDFNSPNQNTQLNEKDIKQVTQIHTMLLAPVFGETPTEIHENLTQLQQKLYRRTANSLKSVCNDLGIQTPQGRVLKMDIVKALINWVSNIQRLIIFCPLT